ncbi:MAG: RNA polymerase sigma-70 factor [Bacteroidales bacterium]|nr:RNA polymerase sigma-70 factor [Bacteroidales bacterium]
MISDNEIIKRIRKGDVRQFESLFRTFYVSLVRYAFSFVRDHDTAEEIVQDVFYRIWAGREKINIKRSLSAYLFRAVHNSCLHLLEHRKVVEKHEKEIIRERETNPESASDLVEYNDLLSAVADVLERLPARSGQIFCMNRFEGLKYAEIAEKLQISVKTVEAGMSRALKEFKKALKEK